MNLNELIIIGKRLGLTGDALTHWVDEEQALEREARAAEREAEREQAEWDERAERESTELEETIRLLRLRVREAEAALSRRAGPSEFTDRSAEGQACTQDFRTLLAARGDLDVYPAQFEQVTTVLEGVARRKVWPEDNLATAPSTLILHTQYTKTGQIERDKAKKGFGSKNPTDSMREHFCYSASWRTNAVEGVSELQDSSPVEALIVASYNDGRCWEGNRKAVPTNASSAPLLEVAGDTTIARGHLNKPLLMTQSFSVFGKGHTHLREPALRA